MFNSSRIAEHLNRYKNDLENLYNWKSNIDKLIGFGIISADDLKHLNRISPFEKEIKLKKKINNHILKAYKTDRELFHELCMWIIKDWGGIKTAKKEETKTLIDEFLELEDAQFKRIASSSKVGAYMYPKEKIIYDSRVAYALNWIILKSNAGQSFFPIPQGRNSKMNALDINVLIRLLNLDNYKINRIEQIDNKKFINSKDKNLFIDKKIAYTQLNKLIKEVSKKLWETPERQDNLFYTEMLLFSIADREIFKEITEAVELTLK